MCFRELNVLAKRAPVVMMAVHLRLVPLPTAAVAWGSMSTGRSAHVRPHIAIARD